MSGDQQQRGRVVVVGAGMAGVQTVVALREEGYGGEIVLIGEETHAPYDRPPLSKAVLLGSAETSAFDVDFGALGAVPRLGVRATGLRAAAHEIDTSEGPLGYDHLVLATGAAPVRLPGTAQHPHVHLLHTLDDVRALREVLARRAEVAVVGAGWIGAEFTTAAREAGCPVTVLEATAHPLSGALPAEVAEPMAKWYAEAGARLRTGARVAAVEDAAVVLEGGARVPADAVLVGIGARPVTGWLQGSGIDLAPDGSVRTDAWLRSSLPDVHAVGDCASFPSPRYGRRLLVHHWDNALQGPHTLARVLTGEEAAPYDPVPYFWSEQFGRFVQYAGDHAGASRLVRRGSPDGAAWSVCWLGEDGRLAAVLAVGRPRDLAQGRKLIASGAVLDPVLLADAARPLKAAAR